MKRSNGAVGFVVRCPKCGAQLRVPSDRLGVKVRCPSCQVVIPVAANLAESARLRRLAPQRGAGLLRSAEPAAAASDGQGMSLRRVLALIGLLCFVLFVIVTGVLLLALPRGEEPLSSDVQTGAAGNASRELITKLQAEARPALGQKQPAAEVQGKWRPPVAPKLPAQGLPAAELIVDAGRIKPPVQRMGAVPLEDRAPPGKQEPPKTRDEIICDLKQRLEFELARIRAEEQARFQASIPVFTYCDKFSAVMRNQDGVELASNIWDVSYQQARYPGSGQASRALNELKRLRPAAQTLQVTRSAEAPRPQVPAALLVPCLVDVQARLGGQRLPQFGVGRIERVAGLAHKARKLTPREPYPEHVAQQGLDRRVRAVRPALEPADKGRQARSNKAGPPDLGRQLSRLESLAMAAPVLRGAVLRNEGRPFDQLHLLDDARRLAGRPERAAAVRASREGIEPSLVDLVGRKRRPLMARMPRLPADATFSLAGFGLLWLDDVAGGRLMGVGGVFAQARVLGLQGLDAGLELQDECLQLAHTGLQAPAVGTFGSRCIRHDPAEYAKPEGKSTRLSRNP